MMELIRQIETPNEWTRDRLAAMYPGWRMAGDTKGFFCPVEETKVVFISFTWKELVRMVEKHLKANLLHVPADLNLEMQARFCEITKSGFCAEHDPYATERTKFVEYTHRFLRAMESAITDGLVSQDEAERRGAICAACPLNQPAKFSFCSGCSSKSVVAKLAKVALGVSTSHDSALKICQNCHCSNTLKIWVKKEAMDYPELREGWHSGCWMRDND